MELLHHGERTAAHARSSGIGDYPTLEAHMPAAHCMHRDWTLQGLVDWGLTIDVATGAPIERPKPLEQGYRGCLGFSASADRYGKDRPETASTVALRSCRYSTVRDIPASGRERVEQTDVAHWRSPEHALLRGARSYN